jgi:hypothetical protein
LEIGERRRVGIGEIDLILGFGRKAFGGDLEQVEEANGIYGYCGSCFGERGAGRLEAEARGVARFS